MGSTHLAAGALGLLFNTGGVGEARWGPRGTRDGTEWRRPPGDGSPGRSETQDVLPKLIDGALAAEYPSLLDARAAAGLALPKGSAGARPSQNGRRDAYPLHLLLHVDRRDRAGVTCMTSHPVERHDRKGRLRTYAVPSDFKNLGCNE